MFSGNVVAFKRPVSSIVSWSDEILKKEISVNGMLLEHVPANRRCHDLCVSAFMNNPLALQWIPHAYGAFLPKLDTELRTPDICMMAVIRFAGDVMAVPAPFLTEEFYRVLVKTHTSKCLYSIPDEGCTTELCLLVLQHSHLLFPSVPDSSLSTLLPELDLKTRTAILQALKDRLPNKKDSAKYLAVDLVVQAARLELDISAASAKPVGEIVSFRRLNREADTRLAS